MMAAAVAFRKGGRPRIADAATETLVFGDYVIERELAHGGMGVVYRARQRSLDRTVALKLLLLGRYSSAENLARFRREAQSAAVLRHSGIVAVHEVGEQDGQPFIAMELVEGGNLAERLRDGPLPARRTAEIVRGVALALHHAHEHGVLHRDVKPSNLLFDRDGAVRISDFGLAKKLDGSSDLTQTGQLAGTPNYLPPEVVAGKGEAAVPGDVYSLGAVLYECLTGRPPFLAESLPQTLRGILESDPIAPRTLNRTVPRDLETICLRALARDPARRFATARDFAEELARWLAGEPIRSRPTSALERAAKWMRRRPAKATAIVLAVLAPVAIIATLALANRRIAAERERAEAHAEESRQRLVRSTVAAGHQLLEEGDAFGALLPLIDALRLDAGDAAREAVHRRRIATVLRSAPQLLHFWPEGGAANFSADGARLFTLGEDRAVHVRDMRSGAEVLPPLRSDPPPEHAWFTPDGARIVTADAAGNVRIWDAATGAAAGPLLPTDVRTTAEHAYSETIDFSRDGRWLLAAMPTGGVQLFDLATGQPLGPALGAGGKVRRVAFTPDGRSAAFCGDALGLQICALPEGRPIFSIPEIGRPVRLFAFSADGAQVAVVSGKSREVLDVWEVATSRRVIDTHRPGINSNECRFTQDGKLVALAGATTAILVDVATARRLPDTMQHRARIPQFEISSSGRWLVTASYDGTARVWQAANGRRASPPLHHTAPVLESHISRSSRNLLTVSADRAVRLWQFEPGWGARLTLGRDVPLVSARFSADGRRIFAATAARVAHLYDAQTGEVLLSLRHPSSIADAALSEDGSKVVTGCADGTAHVWDAARGVKIVPPVRHGKRITRIDISRGGECLATVSDDSTARRWDTATGRERTPPLAHGARVRFAIFSPDGGRILTGSADGTAQLWDAHTGGRVGPPMTHDAPVEFAAFAPDGGRLILLGSVRESTRGIARLWDTATFQPIGPALAHGDRVTRAAFSPDGRRVAIACMDGTAHVYDAATATRLLPPLREDTAALDVAFSPDGRLLLSTHAGKAARVWDSLTGEPATPALQHNLPVTRGAWSPDGRECVTACADGAARVWDVSPTTASPEELLRLAEFLAAKRLDRKFGPVALTPEEMRTRWPTLRADERSE